jgi:predicted HTH domain antitoxin
MQIELPDSLTGNMQKDDVLLDLAVGMYAARHLTLGQAAELSNISQGDFQSELGRRQIAVQYDLEDLAYDLRAASELAR